MLALSAVLAFGASIFFVIGVDRPAQLFAIFAGLLVIAVLAYQRALERTERAERIGEIQKEVEENPGKAKPAWDLASAKLEAYVARNLSQVSWIFMLALIVMAMGFVIIGFGIYRVFSTGALAPSIVAAASGIVVQFIAATFLLIYRATMEQAKDYVAMLERINAVGMSAQLLETIEDADPKVKDRGRAELAKSLLQLYGQVPARNKRVARPVR
jgi:membrane protein implicated in regulation of membrane protease activity